MASAFVAEETVRLTRDGQSQRVGKPAFDLKTGDELAFLMTDRVLSVARPRLCRRGSAPDAARLYDWLNAR